jgi:hypothetical protein
MIGIPNRPDTAPMRTRLLLLVLAALLAACGPRVVQMKALEEFPRPLIEPLPVRVGLYLPPEFSSYTYKEKRPGPAGQEWTISIGPPQTQVFTELLGGLFSGVDVLDSPTDGKAGLSAVIVPTVAEFQFALPSDPKAKVCEIWVKYDLGILDAKGTEIGHWQFTAYGKTPTAFLTSDEEAIRAATIVGLRDAGASLISGLERDPRLREWLGVEANRK